VNSADLDGDVESYTPALPVVAFRFTCAFRRYMQICELMITGDSDEFKKANPNIQQKWIQTLV